MGHAKAIAGVDAERQIELMKLCVSQSLSVRQTEEFAQAMQESDEGYTPAPKKKVDEVKYPDSYMRLVEQLEGYFSQNVSIKRAKNGGGKITIDFKNDEEIDTFISRFEEHNK